MSHNEIHGIPTFVPSSDGGPLVSIIVVSLSGRNLLEHYLPSVISQTYECKEIILVDNGSSDGSVEFIRDRYPSVKVLANKRNLGTAEGSNSGLAIARGDYILWLSNDMELEPDFLSRLMGTITSDPRIGVCTCKMRRMTPAGKKLMVIDSVGGDLDRFGFPSARGINQPDLAQLDKTTDVFFSFGGAMLIKRIVLIETGGFDSRAFTLGDDIDLCWRVHLANYRVVVNPQAVLYHRVSATLGTMFSRSRKRFWSERNCMMALLKNYSASSLVKILPRYIGLLVSEFMVLIILRKEEMSLAVLRAITWNLRNFPGTISRRIGVQRTRKLSDRNIFSMMDKGSFKIRIFQYFLKTRKSEDWKRYFGT